MANKKRFNIQQQEAIDASVNEDILISAGAGSGKTNTLSERVCEIILGDKVKPSELLVLTFTNNAAHEMKERILSKFPKSEQEKANQLLSSHIQTFDSLYQYLVSRYSIELGIANKLNILDDNLAKTKRSEIIDEIFNDYYKNPAKAERLIRFISKVDMKSDRSAKKNVLFLWDKLDSMGKKEKEDFIVHYDERFYSVSFVESLYHSFLSNIRESLIDVIYEAAFAEYHYDIYCQTDLSLDKAKAAFSSLGFWGKNYDSFSFQETQYAEPLYEAIVSLLKLDDEAFVMKAKTFQEDYAPLLVPRTKGLPKEDKARLEKPWSILKRAIGLKDSLIRPAETLGTIASETDKLLKTKEDVDLLLSLAEEADKRFTEFKKTTNSFSFSDIGDLALSLLTDPKYENAANEIRSRFSYIMVDEYQDTNPAQEAFLESFLKVNKEGKRAHLFVVGDAKQSIYLFRGSVVALFRERQKRYMKGLSERVITMNYNYRSGKLLLDDINYICSHYMRLNHGSIDYKGDQEEHLCYDDEVNLYRLPYEDFGIHRIITPNLPLIGNAECAKRRNEKEAFTILTDIKKKISEGYQVYDRSSGIRPCKASDFAILMRTKSKFGLYEKLFNQNGVKLNKVISTNLREANAVILIESLIKMFQWMSVGGKEDPRHLFASIARSYAYEYSDTRLYQLLHNEGKDSLELVKADELWNELESFVASYKNAPFHDIYLALIRDFHVVDKLYKIGDIEDNISKIESLYCLVLSNESSGNGIENFVNLFANMNRYSLEWSTDTLTKNSDAVDMMTIHASKGLERKIVYMPVSLNAMTKTDHRNAPDFGFSSKKGITFPDLSFDPPLPSSPNNQYVSLYETVATRVYKTDENDPEVDDHVRLFYVALTRAENQVIIVGDDDKKRENLYSMLDEAPHHLTLNDSFIRKKIEEGVIKENDYENFLVLKEAAKNVSLPLSSDASLPLESRKAYERLGKKYYLDIPLQLQNEALFSFARSLYLDYETRLSKEVDEDLYTRVFVAANFPYLLEKYSISSFSTFFLALSEERKNNLIDDIAYGNGVDPTYIAGEDDNELPPNEEEDGGGTGEYLFEDLLSLSEEELKTYIFSFVENLRSEDYQSLQIQIPTKKSDSKDDKEVITEIFVKMFLPALMKAFDDTDWLTYLSYENGEYRDKISFMSEYFSGEVTSKLPCFHDYPVDERKIDFPILYKERASKTISFKDEEIPSASILEKGIHLHRLLELVDIASGDLSFIQDEGEKEIIHRVLSLPIMELAKNGEIYHEYGYYDHLLHSTGYIDLFFKNGDDYFVVDYKTSHLDDPAYVKQLHIYKENVMRLFNVTSERVHLYLISILQGKQKAIL